MFCPKCGKQIPDDSSFCMFCGRSIPQVFPVRTSLEQEPYQKAAAPKPFQTPPAPFGDSESFLDEELPFEEDYVDPPVEPETFVPEELPDDLELPDEDFHAPCRCTLCGRDLPASNVTGICVTCTNNRSFVPAAETFQLDLDLDDEYPEEYRENGKRSKPEKKRAKAAKQVEKREKPKRRFPLLPILIAALLVAALGCFGAYYLNNGGGAPTGTSSAAKEPLSDEARAAAAYAQTMVKEKAANPSSVHFDTRSLAVSQKKGVWTVEQSFERLAPSGETAQSSYTAVLSADASAAGGYKPLMLKVDDAVLYDYR